MSNSYSVLVKKCQGAFDEMGQLAEACGAFLVIESVDDKAWLATFTFESDDRYQGGDFSYCMASLDEPEAGQYLVDPDYCHYQHVHWLAPTLEVEELEPADLTVDQLIAWLDWRQARRDNRKIDLDKGIVQAA